MPVGKEGIVAGEDIIMASQRELRRLHLIRKVLEKEVTQAEAGEILWLSVRQIGRIVERVRREGNGGVVHRLRGKRSNRCLGEEIQRKVVGLYQRKYEGFGPTLAAEKMEERDGIRVGDETLRLWLLESGDWKKSRKRRGYRQWRERRGHFGEMVQMDGSHHDWFEGRGGECVLMGYVDDATGEGFGRFYEYEGTMPAMDSFRRYIGKYGIPVSVYLDRHTTYKSNGKASLDEELAGEEALTEFERALKELGVEVIHAHSPQAKGRIERFFGTLQDRLVKELRLRRIGTVEEANEYLGGFWEEYNQRFRRSPREEGDLHREISSKVDLDRIFCWKAKRALRNDFTVSYKCKLYQVEDAIRASQVGVEERLDGSIVLRHKDRGLHFREIEVRPRPQKKAPGKAKAKKKKKKYIPPLDHSWRNFTFGKGKLLSQISSKPQL
jgi:hypothetical protein